MKSPSGGFFISEDANAGNLYYPRSLSGNLKTPIHTGVFKRQSVSLLRAEGGGKRNAYILCRIICNHQVVVGCI